ncbi:MAG TPA: hypothetical protein VFG56_00335, partial [Candidatus Saccharimonadales bacterium]|nr:hypothetical protein [Candidatus Saccharimonadales bacterium]
MAGMPSLRTKLRPRSWLSAITALIIALAGVGIAQTAAQATSRPIMSITEVELTCSDAGGSAAILEFYVNNSSPDAGVYDYETLINDRVRSGTDYFDANDSHLVREFFGDDGFTGLTGEESSYTIKATGSTEPGGPT